MFFDLLALAWGNMRRARLRLLMTLAGVIVATATVMILIALTIGLQNVAEGSIGGNAILTEITVLRSREPLPNGDILRLDDEAVALFEGLDGVRSAVPLLPLGSRTEFNAAEYTNYLPVMGIPADKVSGMNFTAQSGTLEVGDNTAFVGANVLPNFADPTATDYMPVTINPQETPISMILSRLVDDPLPIPLTISGELVPNTSRFDNTVFISIEDVLSHRSYLSGEVTSEEEFEYEQILIRTANRNVTNEIRNEIQNIGYEVDTVGSLLDDINTFFGSLRLVMGLTGGIALLVSAIVVTNTMMMTVLERTNEIGVMKAIGARDRDVLMIFLFEAGLVGLTGGLIGIALALILSENINQYVSNNATAGNAAGFLPINTIILADNDLLVLPQNLLFIGIAIVMTVCILAGFFPAWRASRLSPVTSLRQ